jgi:hypothetical protein
MPFGQKRDGSGATIDFDAVYRDVIRPAIDAADLAPIRADEEKVGGIIQKPMYERLLFCDYAVADLTTANANVFYELGVRHAVRPHSTVTLASKTTRLPFDLNHLRTLMYDLGTDGLLSEAGPTRDALTGCLREARGKAVDSPVFQLVEGLRPAPIDHTKTDAFRDQVRYSEETKAKLRTARAESVEAVRAVEAAQASIADTEAGVVIDLFLSYRAVRAWPEMVALVGRMSPPLAATAMVREQLAFALNRSGDGEEAERVLLELLEKRGASSETSGLLGRVYKDRWEAAVTAGDTLLARGLIDKAVGAYLTGFETDWRDSYPGVNTVTLMELREPPDPRRNALLPVVRYAVDRKIATGSADCWDWATVVELEVLASHEPEAMDALAAAVGLIRETWEPETTARNIRLIRMARERRGVAEPWLSTVEHALVTRSQ